MVTGLKMLDTWAKEQPYFPSRLAVQNKIEELIQQEPRMLKMQHVPHGDEFSAWLAEGIGKAETFGPPEVAAVLRQVREKAKELKLI